MKPAGGMRILWQRSIATEQHPVYADAIRRHAQERCASPCQPIKLSLGHAGGDGARPFHS
jgi:hypothetical protein